MLQTQILIVEDEGKLLEHLKNLVVDAGFMVDTRTSYRDLENVISDSKATPGLIVLDRLLNGRDASELLPKIKSVFLDVKIMILSAINTPSEKAAILDLGADDYLAKPFDGEELIARIRVLLRRNTTELKLGNLTLDSDKRTMFVGDQQLTLPNREFILLKTLLKSPGKVFTKTALYEQVWEVSTDIESNVIETTVNKLRRRLEDVGATVNIRSMRNKGYWLEE